MDIKEEAPDSTADSSADLSANVTICHDEETPAIVDVGTTPQQNLEPEAAAVVDSSTSEPMEQ